MRGSSTGFVKPFLIIMGVVVAMVVVAFCVAAFGGGNKDLGAAVDFEAADVNGNAFHLADNFGKRGTVLVFWDKQKSDCRALLENLSRLCDAKSDVCLTVIAAGEPDGAKLQKYCAEQKYKIDVLIADDELKVFEKYHITSCPISYFVDKNGSVRAASLSSLNEDAAAKYLSYISD